MQHLINFSNIQSANRLDAEYFQLLFTNLEKKIKLKKYLKLQELCEFIHTGPSGTMLPSSHYISNGIKIIRPSNLNGWTCQNGKFAYISKEFCDKKNLKLYNRGDILISRIGDLKFGILQEDQVTISPNLIALRTKKELLDPFFLITFLNSHFGFTQIHRGTKKVSLASIEIHHISNTLIPARTFKEQIKISTLVKKSLTLQKKAIAIYSSAEKLLIKSAPFQNITNKKIATIIAHSELLAAQRADPEYFLSPNYKIPEITKTILLGKISHVIRGIDPGRKAYQNNGKLFLRVGNISKFGLLKKSQKYLSEELFAKLSQKYQPQVNEILLVKDGKPGVACLINQPLQGIISDGIVRLQLHSQLPPEYVYLCLNSSFCQQQIQTHIDGSLIPHWKIEQIKNLKIPIVSSFIQEEITQKIKKSNLLFQKSEKELSIAQQLPH